jgi:hypothetical protein
MKTYFSKSLGVICKNPWTESLIFAKWKDLFAKMFVAWSIWAVSVADPTAVKSWRRGQLLWPRYWPRIIGKDELLHYHMPVSPSLFLWLAIGSLATVRVGHGTGLTRRATPAYCVAHCRATPWPVAELTTFPRCWLATELSRNLLAGRRARPRFAPLADRRAPESHVWFEDRWMIASWCDEWLTTWCGVILG